MRGEQLELVIQSGIELPGAPGTRLLYPFSPLLSKTGRITFWGKLTGDFIESTNDAGIWAEDHLGRFQLIARESDMVDVDPGPEQDLRRIAELTLLEFYESRGEDDQPYAFNNRGQIAFRVAFSDLTQAILVSNLLVIPEPAAQGLAGIVALLLVQMKMRRRDELIESLEVTPA